MADFSDDFNRSDGTIGNGWTTTDLGGLVSEGIVSNEFVLRSTGEIDLTADDSVLISRAAPASNFVFEADIVGVTYGGTGTPRMLMIRESLAAGSRHVTMAGQGTTDDSRLTWRASTNGSTSYGSPLGYAYIGQRISLRYISGEVQLLINGVERASQSISWTPGYIAFTGNRDNIVTFDDAALIEPKSDVYDITVRALEPAVDYDITLDVGKTETGADYDITLRALEPAQDYDITLRALESAVDYDITVRAVESGPDYDVTLRAIETATEYGVTVRAAESGEQYDVTISAYKLDEARRYPITVRARETTTGQTYAITIRANDSSEAGSLPIPGGASQSYPRNSTFSI